jgi:type IV pilus assembly protein PilM
MIMADVAWGVDIGRTSLKAVKMQRMRDTVEITGVDVIDYYGSSEEPPSAAEIRQALVQFKERNKVKGSECICVAVPGYSAFSRFIKLSPVEAKKMGDVVQYEAAQQIPFPLTDVVWEFQKAEREYAPGEEIDVGLFAIKKEIVNRFLSHFDTAKLHVDLVTIAPLTLYNFTKHEMDVPENAVVVDIGADHTDLVIMHGSKFYVRNLPLAGNDITRSLKEKFDLSFEEAEKLKIRAGKSKQAEKIFSVMQPVLREFVGEIVRSVGFYKSQAGNVSFEHLVLLGNATKLDGLAKYLASNLDMKIHRFFDIVHMELSRDLELRLLEEHLPSFAIAMGLALQALGKGRYTVNLMPAERRGQRIIARKKPLLVGSVSLIFVLLLFMFLAGRSRINATEAALARADDSLGDYGNLEGRLAEAKKYDDLEIKGDELVALSKARNIPIDVLNSFNSAVPIDLDRIPEELKGFQGENLPPNLKLPPNVDIRMDEVNKEKMWLLGLNYSTETDEKTGAESLNIEFIGAVVFDEREEETREKVKEKIAKRIAELFNTPVDKLMELPPDRIIKNLVADPRLSQVPDDSKKDYFKFILKWSVPLRPGFKKAEEAPKKPLKAK